jgi:threonine/homoserine/homoserine lactone efflux protein
MSPTFAIFALASFILAITPGPGVIFLVARTLSQGRSVGLASIGGVALGNFGNASLASLGLAVVFAASSAAFLLVKLAGAAYLVFLGVRALISGSTASPAAPCAPTISRLRAFRDGFLVALLNPKTALFFAAFLPQFVGRAGSLLAQSLFLSGVFVLIAICTDTAYVLAADALGPRLTKLLGWRSYGRYVTAATFIALGAYVAFGGPGRAAAVDRGE